MTWIIPLPFALLDLDSVDRNGKSYKNLNVLGTKRAVKIKQKTFFIVFEGLSLDEKVKIW